MRSPLKLGLTGGLGCGKSSVAALFRAHGFATIETDAVVRELLSQDRGVIDAVAQTFGETVLARPPNGGAPLVDRAALARIVFAEEAQLKRLEEILHPPVRHHWQSALANDPQKDWVVEIPLLFEKGLEKAFDYVVCVFASEQTCLARVLRKGLDTDSAKRRMSRQWPLVEKAKRADVVLLNNGSRNFLEAQVHWLLPRLRDI